MTKIAFKNGENSIINELGPQAKGSFTANSEGLNPRELTEAALGLCVSINLKKLLERDGHLTDDTELSIEVTAIKSDPGDNRFDRFDVKIGFPDGLSEDYKQKLMVMAERGCTIGNTLKGTCVIESTEA